MPLATKRTCDNCYFGSEAFKSTGLANNTDLESPCVNCDPNGRRLKHLTREELDRGKITIVHVETYEETLRDEYAGRALAGMLANPKSVMNINDGHHYDPGIVESSYNYADAMIAERAKRKGGS